MAQERQLSSREGNRRDRKGKAVPAVSVLQGPSCTVWRPALNLLTPPGVMQFSATGASAEQEGRYEEGEDDKGSP